MSLIPIIPILTMSAPCNSSQHTANWPTTLPSRPNPILCNTDGVYPYIHTSWEDYCTCHVTHVAEKGQDPENQVNPFELYLSAQQVGTLVILYGSSG